MTRYSKDSRYTQDSKSLPLPQSGGIRKMRNADWLVVDTLPLVPEPRELVNPTPPPPEPPRRKINFRVGWSFWALVILILTMGTGVGAVMVLFKLPALPNCPSLFLPTASTSMRVYCAELAANKQTVNDLLEAIALLKDIPPDHPNAPLVEEYLAQWSKDVLNLADASFQKGQLETAITTARKIPANTPAHALVEQQVKAWRDLWQKADGLYQQAEQALRDGDWPAATRYSNQLLSLPNRYWAENKYTELLEKGKQAREDAKQLNRAYQLVSMGSISNLIEAIEIAKAVNPNSYAYNPAQKIIQEASDKLINIARTSLDNEDWQGIIQISNRLARVVDTPEARRLDELAQAVAKSQEGTSGGLEAALARIQRIDQTSPFADRIQRLSARWRQEIDGLQSLERARQLASSGRAMDLVAAIAQAQLVPRSSPRYNEAVSQIRRWTEQVESNEDRPILTRAEQLAVGGNSQAYQAAIQQASLIAPNRALYREAQDKISQWSTRLESDQDQPFLDQAQALARGGNYAEAISVASQIANGRTLYNQAQTNIRTWQSNLGSTVAPVENSQPRNYVIPEVVGIPSPTPDSEGQDMGELLLATAQGQSQTDILAAIATAQSIPTDSAAYPLAQAQIQEWQRQLGVTP